MATEVRSLQGDTVDRICHRVYGRTAGVTEAVFAANHGLAELGPILPIGTPVRLPALAPQPTRPTVKLWD